MFLTIGKQVTNDLHCLLCFRIRPAGLIRRTGKEFICRQLGFLDEADAIFTNREDDRCPGGSKVRLLLNHDSFVIVLFASADEQCTSYSTDNVDRTGSAVDRFRAKHLIQMVDDHDRSVGLLRNSDQMIEAGPDLICRIELAISDIRGERIKDQKLCSCGLDRFFNPCIIEGDRSFLLIDKDQFLTVTIGPDEARNDGIVCIIFRGLIDHTHRFRWSFRLRKRKRFTLGQHGCDGQQKSTFAIAGIALNERDLAVRDEGIPEPIDRFWIDLRGPDQLQLRSLFRFFCHICVFLSIDLDCVQQGSSVHPTCLIAISCAYAPPPWGIKKHPSCYT